MELLHSEYKDRIAHWQRKSLKSIERTMTDCQDEVSESVAQTNESLKSIERTMTDCQDEVSEFQATAN